MKYYRSPRVTPFLKIKATIFAYRIFLCLFVGGQQQLPEGLGTEDRILNQNQVSFIDKR